ncbi:MAG: flagellar basal body rod C-terminal domain-containing protein, partial [Oscillospiraceae bacterium]
LEETGRPFDMAIVGNGFFNVQGEKQKFLTRNGNFDIDAEGYLVLTGAGKVVGENGPIKVSSSDFTVLPDGTVKAANGTTIDTLLITQPEAGTQLEKYVNGLYIAPQNQKQVDSKEFQAVQNNLETANYDVNREYTLIMEAQRAFQACSSALKMLDGISQKTATQIGSV